MSAYLCNYETINGIVNFATSFGKESLDVRLANGSYRKFTPDEIGAELWTENLKSVNARYRESEKLPHPYKFKFNPYVTAIVCIKLIHCVQYQSCEHVEWNMSNARCLLQHMESRATYRLPGYDVAPWGLPDVKDEARPVLLSDLAKRSRSATTKSI